MLFHLDDMVVLINDVIKMISGNKPENTVFKYRIARYWNGFLANTPDENDMLNYLCNSYTKTEENSMAMSVTKDEITNRNTINKKVKKIKTLMKFMPNFKNYTETIIKSKLTRGYKASTQVDPVTGKNKYMNEIDAMAVRTFIDTLRTYNWKLYYGYAGNGKTWNAINDINTHYQKHKNTKVICISLAFKVQISFKQRLLDTIKGFPVNQFENAALAGLHKIDFNQYNDPDSFIVIDEFSQAARNEYLSFIPILKAAPKANYIFMGDVNQIMSFISHGSVLNTMIEEFKGTKHLVELKTNKRSEITLADAAKNFSLTGNIDEIFYAKEKHDLDYYDVIITGRNINVGQLNNQYVSKKFKIPSGINVSVNSVNSNDVEEGYNVDTRRMLVTAMRKGKTVHLFGGAYSIGKYDKVTIVNGEKWNAKYDRRSKKVKLIDELTKSKIIYMEPKIFINTPYFVPGYAINVNKAQGLEWPKVLVKINMDKHKGPCDMNVYTNRESMYVALSRGKKEVHLDCNGNLKNECKPYIRVNNYLEAQLK
jgi:hypothetical protein